MFGVMSLHVTSANTGPLEGLESTLFQTGPWRPESECGPASGLHLTEWCGGRAQSTALTGDTLA